MSMAQHTCGELTIYYDPAQVRIAGTTIYLADRMLGSTITLVYERWEQQPETPAEVKARLRQAHHKACQQHFRHDLVHRDVKPHNVVVLPKRRVRRLVPGPASRQPRRPD